MGIELYNSSDPTPPKQSPNRGRRGIYSNLADHRLHPKPPIVTMGGSRHRDKTPTGDEQTAPPSPESIMDAPHQPAAFALPKSIVPPAPVPDDRLHEDTWSMVPGVLMSVVMVAATELAQESFLSIALVSWLVGW